MRDWVVLEMVHKKGGPKLSSSWLKSVITGVKLEAMLLSWAEVTAGGILGVLEEVEKRLYYEPFGFHATRVVAI